MTLEQRSDEDTKSSLRVVHEDKNTPSIVQFTSSCYWLGGYCLTHIKKKNLAEQSMPQLDGADVEMVSKA